MILLPLARHAERFKQVHHHTALMTALPGATLARLGGADLIISTASTTEPVNELVDGLAVGGRLTPVGVDGGNIQVPAALLAMNGQTTTGHLTGTPTDVEDAMASAFTNGIHVVQETYPLEPAAEALERLASGGARFRVVLETGGTTR